MARGRDFRGPGTYRVQVNMESEPSAMVQLAIKCPKSLNHVTGLHHTCVARLMIANRDVILLVINLPTSQHVYIYLKSAVAITYHNANIKSQ